MSRIISFASTHINFIWVKSLPILGLILRRRAGLGSRDNLPVSGKTGPSRLGFQATRIMAFCVLAIGLASCANTPRPSVTINPENRAKTTVTPVVSARIVPNQFPVTEVVLEFGRRPSASNGVSISYDSTPASYNLRRNLSTNLPTMQPFDVSFRLSASSPAEFQVGEIIDYQFKITHLTENNSPLFFWSERKSFQIERPNSNGVIGNPGSGTVGSDGGEIVVVNPSIPNVLPYLATPHVVTRPLNSDVIATPNGGMVQINPFFCSGLSTTPNIATSVDVPPLVWGVVGTNIELANIAFNVELRDADRNTVLSTLNLAQGFPANTPLVQTENYPGRPSSLRVILNPRFQVGSAIQTTAGCFTAPGSTPRLDPNMVIRVDTNNTINEGEKENDNELPL